MSSREIEVLLYIQTYVIWILFARFLHDAFPAYVIEIELTANFNSDCIFVSDNVRDSFIYKTISSNLAGHENEIVYVATDFDKTLETRKIFRGK